MPHLAGGDARLYYEDEGDGPPILMTHGFVASTVWTGKSPRFEMHTVCPLGYARPRTNGMSRRSISLRPGHHHRRHGRDTRPSRDRSGHHCRTLLGRIHVAAVQCDHPTGLKRSFFRGAVPDIGDASRAKWNERVDGRAKMILEEG